MQPPLAKVDVVDGAEVPKFVADLHTARASSTVKDDELTWPDGETRGIS
jgi:hypothetical protein